jgi:hypothetical protein
VYCLVALGCRSPIILFTLRSVTLISRLFAPGFKAAVALTRNGAFHAIDQPEFLYQFE